LRQVVRPRRSALATTGAGAGAVRATRRDQDCGAGQDLSEDEEGPHCHCRLDVFNLLSSSIVACTVVRLVLSNYPCVFLWLKWHANLLSCCCLCSVER
jgi:hypothetical protein